MLEREIYIYLLKKEYYNTLFEYIDLQHVKSLSNDLFHLYQVLPELHQLVGDKDLSLADVEAYFFTKYAPAKPEPYQILLKTISETTLSEEVGVGTLKQLKRRQAAAKLSEKSFMFLQGKATADELRDLADAIADTPDGGEVSSDGTDVSNTEITKIIQHEAELPGLHWGLESLERSIGPLRLGNFGFILARPEAGKSAFVLGPAEAAMAQQALAQNLGPVLHINNEEEGSAVIIRFHQAVLRATRNQIYARPEAAQSAYTKRIGDKWLIRDQAGITRGEIEALLKKYKPCLLVIDQIDKVEGFSADRDDLVLGAKYQWAREIAKRYCPVIGVTQADGTAEGVKWLNMGHVANAKTAKQAEADWILGIGKVNDPNLENVRYFHLSKNKLCRGPKCEEKYRHASWEVLIRPEISNYEDI